MNGKQVTVQPAHLSLACDQSKWRLPSPESEYECTAWHVIILGLCFNVHVPQCFPAKALLSFWCILTSVTWHPNGTLKQNKKKSQQSDTELSTTAGTHVKYQTYVLWQWHGEDCVRELTCIQRHDKTESWTFSVHSKPSLTILHTQMLLCLTWRENMSNS